MESSTVISLEVLSNDREGVTEDKAIQSNPLSKQTTEMCFRNMNQFPDQNEINMCDDDVPNILEPSIDKADVVRNYQNNTQITDETIEAGCSRPTETMSINQQTEEAGASSVHMNNYINILSADELRVSSSNNTKAILITPNNIGITKQTDAMSTKPTSIRRSNAGISEQNACYNLNKLSENAPKTHCMTNKSKLALALLVVLVITVLAVCLIVWGVGSRYQENIKGEPAINLTTICFTACWNKSVNCSEHCNISMVTEATDLKEINTTSENISKLMSQKNGKNIYDLFLFIK